MELQRIGDRALLLLFCIMLLLQQGMERRIILGMLLAFIVSCIGCYTTKHVIRLVSVGVFLVISIWNHSMILLYPVLMYELVTLARDEESKMRGAVAVSDLFMLGMVCLYIPAFSLFQILGALSMLMLSVWLNWSCYHNTDLRHRLIVIRDDSTETTMELEYRN